MALRRLTGELKDGDFPPGCSAGLVNDNDLFLWNAYIIGPLDTPFAGGVFHLEMKFSNGYPFQRPHIKIITPIFHCNITEQGRIGLNILKYQWSPIFYASTLLLSIRALLCDPNPDDPKNEEAAKLYKADRMLHDIIAKKWTIKFAQSLSQLKDSSIYFKQNKEMLYIQQSSKQRQERYANIKNCVLNLFGEMSICHMIVMYEGEHGETLPENLLNTIVADVVNGDVVDPDSVDLTEDNGYNERSEMCQLFIKTMTNKTCVFDIDVEEKVVALKQKIADQEGAPIESQSIIYCAKQLQNHRSLASYGVQNYDILYMTLRLRG